MLVSILVLKITDTAIVAGEIKFLTISLSVNLERIETIEIGLISVSSSTGFNFGTGLILATFHCNGTMEFLSERLIA